MMLDFRCGGCPRTIHIPAGQGVTAVPEAFDATGPNEIDVDRWTCGVCGTVNIFPIVVEAKHA